MVLWYHLCLLMQDVVGLRLNKLILQTYFVNEFTEFSQIHLGKTPLSAKKSVIPYNSAEAHKENLGWDLQCSNSKT